MAYEKPNIQPIQCVSRIGGGGACKVAVSYLYGKYFNDKICKAKGGSEQPDT